MIPKHQEIKLQPGLQFDTVIQNSLAKIEPEDPKRASFFDKLYEDANEIYIGDPDSGIKVEEQIFINKMLRRQIWRIQFTKLEPDVVVDEKGKEKIIVHEYERKLIEGLLVLPNDFPKRAPKFYFGFFKDNTKIIHENIYGDGLLCIPQLTQNWQDNKGVEQALSAIQNIFFNPNLNDPANPIFAQAPSIEKIRRRKQQATQFEVWQD